MHERLFWGRWSDLTWVCGWCLQRCTTLVMIRSSCACSILLHYCSKLHSHSSYLQHVAEHFRGQCQGKLPDICNCISEGRLSRFSHWIRQRVKRSLVESLQEDFTVVAAARDSQAGKGIGFGSVVMCRGASADPEMLKRELSSLNIHLSRSGNIEKGGWRNVGCNHDTDNCRLENALVSCNSERSTLAEALCEHFCFRGLKD